MLRCVPAQQQADFKIPPNSVSACFHQPCFLMLGDSPNPNQVEVIVRPDAITVAAQACDYVYNFVLQNSRSVAQTTERRYDERRADWDTAKLNQIQAKEKQNHLKILGLHISSGSDEAIAANDLYISDEKESLRQVRYDMLVMDEHLRKLMIR